MYNDLPAPVQSATLLIGAATAAVALSGGAALLAIPKWAEFRATVTAAGFSMGRMALQGAGVGAALSVATAAVGVLIAKQAEMRSGAEELAGSLNKTTGAVTQYTRELISKKLADQGAFAGAKEAGVGQRELTEALYKGGDAYEDVMRRLRAAHDASGGWNATIGNSINATKDLNVQIGDARQRFEDTKAAQEGATGALQDGTNATADNSSALAELAGKASSTKVDVEGLADAIRGFGSAQLDTNSAARGFEQALDDLQDSINKNGSSLDRTAQAGRDNEERLDGLAKATLEWAAATVQQTGNQDDANQIIQTGRDQLVGMLDQFGITGQAAQDYADRLGLIPGQIPTAVELNTSTAEQQITAFLNRWNGVQIRAEMFLDSSGGNRAAAASAARYTAQAQAYLNANANYSGGFYEKAKVKQFDTGGFASGIYNGRAEGIHKFAEGNLPWEAYISPHPGHRQKNLAILDEVGYRLHAWQRPSSSAAPQPAAVGAPHAPITYAPVINQRPGVSDRRIAQVAQEEFAFGMG
jgi:uncharacterized protein YukE